jgi:uncharacterized protein (DUF305 family)
MEGDMSTPIRQPLNFRVLSCVLVLALTVLVGVAWAQEHFVSMQFMERMQAVMTEMDRSMKAAPMNGDIDHDFATMMIPHHDGAIEMAKAELLYGTDPTMRRMAQEILVDQQSEIDAMNLWLARRAPKPSNKDVGK